MTCNIIAFSARKKPAKKRAQPPRSDQSLLILVRLSEPGERIIYQHPGPLCRKPHPWWLQFPQVCSPRIHIQAFKALRNSGLIADDGSEALALNGASASYYRSIGHAVYAITDDGRLWLKVRSGGTE